MSDFQRDLEASSSDFLRVVWPAIGPLVGGGEIVPVESVADKGMATMLDQRSGIDAWHLSRDKQVRGIASRVQWGSTAWNTFTVRYARHSGASTEYEKRKNDIYADAGWLYPHLTVQAYIGGSKAASGDLLSVAVIKTKSLIDACDQVIRGEVDKRKEGGFRDAGNATFIWLGWAWLQRSGYEIKILERERATA